MLGPKQLKEFCNRRNNMPWPCSACSLETNCKYLSDNLDIEWIKFKLYRIKKWDSVHLKKFILISNIEHAAM